MVRKEAGISSINKTKKPQSCPYGSYQLKSHGPLGSPMAFFPIRGFALWVTYAKIKIKIEKIEDLVHGFSLGRIVSEFKLICQGANMSFRTSSATLGGVIGEGGGLFLHHGVA
jgi:hypothetical protein